MSSETGSISYIQHPANTPLQLQAHPTLIPHHTPLPIGLICNTDSAFDTGTAVEITSPRLAPQMRALGRIAWCRCQGNGYQVGVLFYHARDLYNIRMLEQLCHIKHYHKLLNADGKAVSLEVAALEWIEKFAAHFPTDGL